MKDQRLNPSRVETPSTSAAVTLYKCPEPSVPLSTVVVIRLPNTRLPAGGPGKLWSSYIFASSVMYRRAGTGVKRRMLGTSQKKRPSKGREREGNSVLWAREQHW